MRGVEIDSIRGSVYSADYRGRLVAGPRGSLVDSRSEFWRLSHVAL